jgi:hypothetical protein
MNIVKYTPALQAALGCKLKAEPWMHAVVVLEQEGYTRADKSKKFGDNNKTMSYRIAYVVYVWDTREVLAEDEQSGTTGMRAKQIAIRKTFKPAFDNHEPLKNVKPGVSQGVARIFERMQRASKRKQH